MLNALYAQNIVTFASNNTGYFSAVFAGPP